MRTAVAGIRDGLRKDGLRMKRNGLVVGMLAWAVLSGIVACSDEPANKAAVEQQEQPEQMDATVTALNGPQQRHYDRLRAFYVVWHDQLDGGIAGSATGQQVIRDFTAREADGVSPDLLIGLEQAVNDTLFGELMFGETDPIVSDRILVANGAPKLSDLLAEYLATLQAIRDRARIETRTEYYLVKNHADEDPRLLALLDAFDVNAQAN